MLRTGARIQGAGSQDFLQEAEAGKKKYGEQEPVKKVWGAGANKCYLVGAGAGVSKESLKEYWIPNTEYNKN